MIARLYVDGEERGQMPVSEAGVSIELFGVEFAPGTHHIVFTVSPDEEER